MKPKRIFTLICGFWASLSLAIACQVTPPTPSPTATTTLLVAAAASLQNSLETIDPLFESANPEITVNYTFAASGALQQQIEQGAPVDLFISAAKRQMDALQQKNLIVADGQRNLLTNRLALVVPRDSILGITDFSQLTNASVKQVSLGEPSSVPAGQYAQQVFEKLGIWDQLQPKFVFGNSVRNVLAAVESGNADAGVIYETDAKTSEQVTQVAIASEDLHSPIVYPMAVIAASQNQAATRTYADFLLSPPAQEILQKYGFSPAP
jgi:molybdate transport system substrate-binding protein